MASCHWGPGLFRVHLETVHLNQRGGAASAQVHPAVTQNIENGGPLGDAHRVVVLPRQQGHGVPDADALGALGDSAVEDFGGRAVGELPQEVVLDRPEVVEADLVGQVHLGQHLLVAFRLDAGVVGFGNLDFIHQAEFHTSFLAGGIFTAILAHGGRRHRYQSVKHRIPHCIQDPETSSNHPCSLSVR